MPSLPLDLERLIFETAALQDIDHDRKIRLILVAKRVYEWVRPILYRVAVVRVGSQGGVIFRNWGLGNPQIKDVAPFTRHLLTLRGKTENTIKLLSTFHNTEDLAIWVGDNINPQVLQKMNDLPLRMLSVRLAQISLDEAIAYCPAFKNLTHLQIISLKGSTWNDCKALAEFPKLTHLCLYTLDKDEDLRNFLEDCPSLRAMIYLPVHECAIGLDDPRFLVFLDRMLLVDSISEWERSAYGRIGLWELADIIIDGRKNKLFKDNSSFTFLRSTWMEDLNDDGVRWYKGWM